MTPTRNQKSAVILAVALAVGVWLSRLITGE